MQDKIKWDGLTDLAYITDQGNAVLNSDIYLTLTYKGGDNVRPVYTSYPQLFRLREALTTVKDLLINNRGFLDAEGVLSVRQEYSAPIILSNIGKAANWISLKLAVLESGENGVVTTVPGVAIEMSTSNGYSSTLTTEEFLTIYTIINDLNLSALQVNLGLAFLSSSQNQVAGWTGYQNQNNFAQQARPQYYQQQYQGQQMQGYQSQPNYQNNTYSTNGGTYNSTPRYNNTGYQRQPQRQVAQQVSGSHYTQNNTQQQPFTQPVQQSTQQYAPQTNAYSQQNNLKPRNEKIMNFNTIEETKVEDLSLDDADAINDIFND